MGAPSCKLLGGPIASQELQHSVGNPEPGITSADSSELLPGSLTAPRHRPSRQQSGMEAHEGPQPGSPRASMRKGRALVVCAEDTAASAAACEWALQNIYKDGDVVHLAYVVQCLKPNVEIFHGMPGTAYSFKQPGQGHTEQHLINAAKSRLEARFLPLLRPQMVPYQLHLYAERCDVPDGRVAELIMQDIEQRDAAMVILAAHNKPGSEEDDGNLGSVAEYLSKNCHRPLVIVRPHKHVQ